MKRNSSMWRTAFAAAAVFTVAGCASSTDLEQVNQNQFMLRGMIANDRQQIDALESQIRKLNDQITILKHQNASAEGGGEVSTLSSRMAKLEAEVAAIQASQATAPSAAGMASEGMASAGEGVAAAAPRTAPEPEATWPQELDQEIDGAKGSREPGARIYREGLAAMKDAKYPQAVALFAKFQHAYPKSELTEPAEYFAANALYELGKYDNAVLQFNDLVMRSPKGRFASQALLRESQAFLKLNDRIDARLTLQKLLADHPGTPEATAANTMMRDLVND